MNDLNSIVEIMLQQIKDNFKSPSFNVWFGDFKLVSLDEQRAVFSTPSDLRKRFLTTKYINLIEEALIDTIGCEVEIEIISTESDDFNKISEEDIPKPTEQQKAEANERESTINEFLTKSDSESKSILEEYTFENFIEGASNKFARAACLAVATEPACIASTSTISYNPLFIYGDSGLGKTHLLYAVINYIKKNHPKLNIVYKKSEDFINELIQALGNKDTVGFKNKYRSADVLLIDDIQFIAGKESTQEEFFHTFSSLYESGKQIILTSDRPPKEIKPLSDRIRTRFEGGLLADVQKPSFELRTAIIRKKSDMMNITIPNDLIDYMAERLQHDIRQIEGALKKLKALYLLNGLSITKDIVDNVISSIDPGNIPTDVLVEKIINITAKYYGVKSEDIKSKSRTDNIAYARHICVYIIKKLTDLSYKAIGVFIGGRDHATLISSYNKVEEYISTKKNTESDIKKIIKEVKQ
ncbi:MAG: chromosomal replication initiator protein DnaA [Clostridia bacterium]|nr:chromosomal replication initiator protein DnaA [Clostridia bacterium]